MSSITIDNFCGRLGNNFLNLSGAFFYAKCSPGITKVKIPRKEKTYSSNVFSNTSLKEEYVFSQEYDFPVKLYDSILWDTTRYYPKEIENYVDINSYISFMSKNITDVYQNEIYNLFNFNEYNLNLKNSIAIHLRSGDILTPFAHKCYIQSPWSYYKKIIDSTSCKKIILCTGGNPINPCYHKIIEYCNDKNIECDYASRNILEDLYILSNSDEVVIGGVSTFSYTACFMSKKVKIIHYPDFNHSFINEKDTLSNLNCKLMSYEFKDYYTSWKYEPNVMMNYPEENITLIEDN